MDTDWRNVKCDGEEVASECRDFSGTHEVADLEERFLGAIVKAIEGVRKQL